MKSFWWTAFVTEYKKLHSFLVSCHTGYFSEATQRKNSGMTILSLLKNFSFRAFILIGMLFPVPIIGQTTVSWEEMEFSTLEGTTVALNSLPGESTAAFYFLSPECPLCENYSLTINQLREKYPNEEIVFYGVFPGKFFSEEEIQAYMDKFKVQVTVLLDPEYKLRDLFKATVTPEVFLTSGTGELLYKGSIDNWIPALGKKRTIITRHYLDDALASTLAGKPIEVTETKAIGCFIE